MRRAIGSFLIIVGIIVSMYAFSAYNLYTASDPINEFETPSIYPVFYIFLPLAVMSIIGGITLLKNEEKQRSKSSARV